MNDETFSQLTYGTIIKIKDKSDTFSKDLFFISYICNEFIDVISNVDLQKTTLLIENGKIKYKDNIEIEEIIIYHHSTEGYAKINSLLPGTPIHVVFVDGSSFDMMNGVITELENDMITIRDYESQELYYIDFQYAGLDKTRFVRIEKTNQNNQRTSNNIDLYDEPDNDTLYVYDMKEQVSDYIYKSTLKQKHKTHILNEIEKYKQLIEHYTDLEKGILIKSLEQNQVYSSFMFLNSSLFYPLTTHAENTSYTDDDDEEENESILTQVKNVKTQKQQMEFMDNLLFDDEKQLEKYRKITPIRDSPFWFWSSEEDDEDLPFSSTKLDKGVITLENAPPFIIINGILFHSCEKIKQQGNIQHGETLLLKTIQNLHNKIEAKKVNVQIKPRDSFCGSKIHTYSILQKGESWKAFIKHTNVNPKQIYDVLKEPTDVNLYDIVRKLSLIEMEKIHVKDMGWCMRYIQENSRLMKQQIQKLKTEWKSITYEPYEFSHFSDVYTKLCEYYNEPSLYQTGHPSEIIHAHHIDYGIMAMYEYSKQNNDLNIKDDSEINEIIQSIQEEVGKVSQKGNTKKRLHVKTYTTLQELQQDNGSIILKDPDVGYENNVQYLYSYLQSQKQPYTEPIELFNTKLQKLLLSYSSTMGEDELVQIQNELFPTRKDLFDMLIIKLIELQVRDQEQCYVKETEEYFVYSNKEWVLLSDHEAKARKKKVLRIKNTNEDIQQSKETLLNDYALNLIQQMHNELNIKSEKQEKYSSDYKLILKKNLLQLNNNKIRHVLKYNTLKQTQEKTFDLTEYLTTIKPSPYFNMMYDILSVDDLKEKYEMIQDFIELLTIDVGDEDWYFCSLNKTKLIPKFLHRLSVSYLTNDNYDQTIKDICVHEGTLSESGDAWIHKKSGITIQPIYFDTNYGYDENGFKITLDAVKEKDTSEIKKETILTPEESRFIPLIRAFTTFIGIRFEVLGSSFGENYNEYVKEIYKIYTLSITKQKEIEIHKHKCYSILGFLLAYVQCNDFSIQDSYPGCFQTFEGYPLKQSYENIKGVEYVSCILYKISQKNSNPPYNSFKSLKQQDIVSELCKYIRIYVMTNPAVLSMIMKKRNVYETRKSYDSNDDEYVRLQGFTKFYPSLKTIVLKPMDVHTSGKNDKSLTGYHKIQDLLMFQNMRLHEFIQKNMEGELPLLNTKSGHPFLINYCCNDGDFISDYLCQGKQAKQSEWEKIKHYIQEYNEILISLNETYILPQNLSIVKSPQPQLQENTMIQSLNDEILIYSYMIHYGNFDNQMPIPEFLSSIIQEKPSEDYYRKHDSIERKILVLQENGYIYDIQHLISAMQLQARTNATKISSINRSFINDELIEKVSQYLELPLINKDIEQIMIDKIKFIKSKLHAHLRTIIPSSLKQLSKIESYLDSFQTSIQNEHYLIFLKQCNESLLQFIPEIILSGNTPLKKSVLCKHWDLADKHKQLIHSQHEETFSMFNSIQSSNGFELEKEFLKTLQTMKSILNIELFKKKESLQVVYDSCVFYTLLFWYTIFDFKTKKLGSNDRFIQNVNKSIYEYLGQIQNFHNTEYSYAKKVNKQLKESEKKLVISSFEKMTEENRAVENSKKILGLGKWSYGKGKQVFKYYKDSYENEDIRANEVKEAMREMYVDDDGHFFDDSRYEMNEIEAILHEEQDDFINEDGDDRFNEEGEIIED